MAQAIRERREQLGLTLRALAARSGVSSSMISDVERGAKSPTISTLSALADALAVPISTLVESASPAVRLRVVRAAERSASVDPASGARRDSFGPALAGSKVEFLRYTVPPRTVAGPFPAHPSGTIEHVHLAAGRVRVTLGEDAAILEAGDSCTCLADTTHGFDNRESDVEALLYLVIEPPS
ncbi:MAG: helix-turn-helix transcriptional regulator [Alphaproteobacteria bacterium]|nr:helix-turn-helix transcriptional regulator [Alphaproteobacteria bacterium]